MSEGGVNNSNENLIPPNDDENKDLSKLPDSAEKEKGDAATSPNHLENKTDSIINLIGQVSLSKEITVEDSNQKILKDTDSMATLKSLDPSVRPLPETWKGISIQVVWPFLIAGIGLSITGILLEQFLEAPVFKAVPEFLIMVTPLLGLKGDLEMTLASRISTQFNLKRVETWQKQLALFSCDIALTQCQSIICGFLASFVAIVVDFIGDQTFDRYNAFLLASAAMSTASATSFILGVLMSLVIFLCKKCNINPDNVATPIAATLGDSVTLIILVHIASSLYENQDHNRWLTPSIILVLIFTIPIWILIARLHPVTKEVLRTGWTPIILAMFISSAGGILLERSDTIFNGVGLYQPLVNGVGGNTVSVQASRMATALHREATMGELPEGSKICTTPWGIFINEGIHSVCARILIIILIPGSILFAAIIYYIPWSTNGLFSPSFVFFFVIIMLIQVVFLLYVARVMTNLFWKKKIDPDNWTIPLLTGFGDLSGTLLVLTLFYIMFGLGEVKKKN